MRSYRGQSQSIEVRFLPEPPKSVKVQATLRVNFIEWDSHEYRESDRISDADKRDYLTVICAKESGDAETA